MGPRLLDNIKYAVFDLDDTLYPETQYCQSGFKAVAAELAKDRLADNQQLYERFLHHFNAGNRKKIFNDVLDEFSAQYDKNYIKKLVDLYRNHLPDINLPVESRNILDSLKGRVKLGLLTDGYMPAQKLKVKSLGIEDYFDIIVYTELLGREFWKPSCAGFEAIMAKDHFEPDQYLYIADNPAKDFVAPNKLGWRSVWLRSGKGVHGTEPADQLHRGEFEINELIRIKDIIIDGD
jgi:putative hydrolase of the HAD superfamily